MKAEILQAIKDIEEAEVEQRAIQDEADARTKHIEDLRRQNPSDPHLQLLELIQTQDRNIYALGLLVSDLRKSVLVIGAAVMESRP